jgi:hypothetical protein
MSEFRDDGPQLGIFIWSGIAIIVECAALAWWLS